MTRLAALIAAVALTAPVAAQTGAGCTADAMLVFDGSASMSEIRFDTGDATRIVEARQAVRRAMPQIAPFRHIGLLIYGPGQGGACDNIDVAFAPRPDAAADVIIAVDAMVPAGLTPLAASVERAAHVLDYRARPAVVVLVTDGNETCGGRPCGLGDRLALSARDLTVHVIGFRVETDFFSWDNPEQQTYTEGATVAKCLADRTGGLFVSTDTVDELAEALQRTLGCPLIGQGVPAPLAPSRRPT